jgi:hypothetical protein
VFHVRYKLILCRYIVYTGPKFQSVNLKWSGSIERPLAGASVAQQNRVRRSSSTNGETIW